VAQIVKHLPKKAWVPEFKPLNHHHQKKKKKKRIKLMIHKIIWIMLKSSILSKRK
jgi:hypothetical protein